MIDASLFYDVAKARGYGFYTGVPCSFLTPFIGHAISDADTQYVAAASEGEAVAIVGPSGSVWVCAWAAAAARQTVPARKRRMVL